jgi:hypothetical protein
MADFQYITREQADAILAEDEPKYGVSHVNDIDLRGPGSRGGKRRHLAVETTVERFYAYDLKTGEPVTIKE